MTLKKNALIGSAIALAFVGSTSVFAAPSAGTGQVHFHGEVVNAACSISPESVDQTVELGSVAAHVLNDGNTSTPVAFNILLEDCDPTLFPEGDDESDPTTAMDIVNVTFSGSPAFDHGVIGTPTETTFLGTDLTNVGIELRNSTGTVIEFASDAEPTVTSQELIAGDNTLHFSAAVAGTGSTVTAGEFSSDVSFNLSYE
ncbi:TPA: fimbrial protein [Vibrio parahaemolyticus]